MYLYNNTADDKVITRKGYKRPLKIREVTQAILLATLDKYNTRPIKRAT
jgi:seryl-tRNA(Sec) selenium transferase